MLEKQPVVLVIVASVIRTVLSVTIRMKHQESASSAKMKHTCILMVHASRIVQMVGQAQALGISTENVCSF